MSKRFDIQDASGIIASRGLAQAIIQVSNKTSPRFSTSTGVPQDSVAGFMTGALVINPFGSVGSLLYINTGTATSSTFLNIA